MTRKHAQGPIRRLGLRSEEVLERIDGVAGDVRVKLVLLGEVPAHLHVGLVDDGFYLDSRTSSDVLPRELLERLVVLLDRRAERKEGGSSPIKTGRKR